MHDDSPARPPAPPWAAPDSPELALPTETPSITEPSTGAEFTAGAERAPIGELPTAAAPAHDPRTALGVWLLILLAFGVGGLILGQQEMAALVALSGVVIAAQAADLLPQWRILYQLVSLALIGLCSASFMMLATHFATDVPVTPARRALVVISALSALALVATALRPISSALSRALFRGDRDSHASRLAARLTLFGLLFAVPGSVVTQELLRDVEGTSMMFERLSLGGSLFGYVILALAAVGYRIRRDTRETIARLGLIRLGLRDLVIVVAGVAVLFGLNAAGEWAQRQWFPASWEADHSVNQAIVAGLDRRSMLMLGLSAGIGEEITMRGALQPRLGIVLTSLLFACFHVQYSWFGIGMVFLFGLALGAIRQRTSTTVAMGVHTAYDVVALATTS